MWKHKNFINLQLCATFKHFYDAGTIGSGTVKFRHYSQQEPSSATLINFTINGTAYQAEEGMTWEQWCNSSYNTDGYYVREDGVITNNVYFVGTPAGHVSSTDTIVSDYSYAGSGAGGGGIR